MKTKLCHLFIALALFAGVHSAQAQPALGIAQAGNQVVFTWPKTTTNWVLQSTTNLSPPGWSNLSLAQVIINGQNRVTNPISGTQQF